MQIGDMVRYSPGGQEWIAQVAKIIHPYCLLIDIDGHLARSTVDSDAITVLLSMGPSGTTHTSLPKILRFKAITDELMGLLGVSEAITLAERAPPDPLGIDLWMLPLAELAVDAPLKPLLRAYYTWPAITRRRFESVCRSIKKDTLRVNNRQYEVLMRVVLGPLSARQLAGINTVSLSSTRMARWRVLKALEAQMGEVVRVDNQAQGASTQPRSA